MIRGKLLSVFLTGLLAFSGGFVFADEEAGSKVFNLGEVVVTGKSEAITQVATVETIDREDIELNNAEDVASALDNMAGLSISVGRRNEANISVRGFSQRYVPVFFDGIPWYIPNDGYVDPGQISTGNISRITLTKGASSTLYGANTMGGVVNIVSMKPTESFEGSFGTRLTKDQYKGNLNLGLMKGKFYFMTGFSASDLDDYNMSDDFQPVPVAGGYYEDGDYRDNSDKKSITKSLKLGFMPSENSEYAIGYHNVRSERGLPTNTDPNERQRFWRFTEWEKSTYYFIGDTGLTENLSAKLRIYHDEYYNILDSYDDGTYFSQTARWAFHSTYDDHTDGGSLVLKSGFFDNNTLSFSYHYKNDVHTEQDDHGAAEEKYEASTSSIGIENAMTVNDKMSMVFGLNLDTQEAEYADGGPLREDDDAVNGVIGMTYELDNDKQLHFSIAKKSRFPTLQELYAAYINANVDESIPNPNLKKEQSINYELGFSSAAPLDSSIEFAVFYSDIEDLIMTTEIGGLEFRGNIGEATTRGFELALRNNYFDKNDIQVSYTFLDAKNNSADRTSDFLEEIPEHQFRITDRITLNDKVSFYAKGKYESGQKQELRNGDWSELDDYWVFDIKAVLNYSENTQLDLSVENLLDENYSTRHGFPREGRMIVFGLRTNF